MIYKRRQFFREPLPWRKRSGHGPLSPIRSRLMRAGNEAALPKRFVFVVKSSGIDKFNLVPEGFENHFVNPDDGKKLGNRGRREGPLVDVPLAEHKLPEKLASLETFKDRLTVIQSLSGVGFRGNHTKGFGTLSLHDSEKVAVAPTLDCLLGQHLSTGPYPMYGMAMNGQLLESAGWKPRTPTAILTFLPTQPPSRLPIRGRRGKPFSNSSGLPLPALRNWKRRSP